MIKLHNTNNLNAVKVFLISGSQLQNHINNKILNSLGFEGKYKQSIILPEKNLIYIGLDLRQTKTIDPFYKIDFFEIGAVLGSLIKSTKLTDFQLENSSIELNSKQIIDFALGFSSNLWSFDKYKKKDANEINTHHRLFLANNLSSQISTDSIKVFEAIQSGIELTREIIEETPETINPSTIPWIIQEELSQYQDIKLQFIDSNSLIDMGMDGINYVGRASDHKPVMVHAVFHPPKTVKYRVCLVGKGVTYDSGGLNIKLGDQMKTMKCDIGGAATIFGLFKTIAINKLEHTEVHWISPFVENMINSNSFKADDIIKSYSGQTIEVHNTDAEGRLTLADALSYATCFQPDYIVDLATLTGACVFALSDEFTAIMGNDKKLLSGLHNAFIQNLEDAQLLTLSMNLKETVEGDISDVINTSKIKNAGHITAGHFLSFFIDQSNFTNLKLTDRETKTYSWAHLDIAGSSYNNNKNKIGAKGATGHGVRSLWTWLKSLDNQSI